MDEVKTYYTTFDGEFEGSYKPKGTEVRKTAREAKYLLLAGSISETKPKKNATTKPKSSES